jgi:hypothetical protein
MNPTHVWEVGDMSAWTDGNEPRRNEYPITVVAPVRVVGGGEAVVVVKALALRAGVQARKADHRYIGLAIAGRRHDEAADS